MYLRMVIEDDFEDRTQGSLNDCLYLLARARPTRDDDAVQRHSERRLTLVKQIADGKPSSPCVGAGSRADPPRLGCPSTREGARTAPPNWRIGRQSANRMSVNVETLGISLGDSRFVCSPG